MTCAVLHLCDHTKTKNTNNGQSSNVGLLFLMSTLSSPHQLMRSQKKHEQERREGWSKDESMGMEMYFRKTRKLTELPQLKKKHNQWRLLAKMSFEVLLLSSFFLILPRPILCSKKWESEGAVVRSTIGPLFYCEMETNELDYKSQSSLEIEFTFFSFAPCCCMWSIWGRRGEVKIYPLLVLSPFTFLPFSLLSLSSMDNIILLGCLYIAVPRKARWRRMFFFFG